jgi:Zn-dependent protease
MLKQIDVWLDKPVSDLEWKLVTLTRKLATRIASVMKQPTAKFFLAGVFFQIMWHETHSAIIATALIAGLYLHELGHLKAMRSVGLPTAGMWFIPPFGAVAISMEQSRSRWDHFLVAVMGPFAGLCSVLVPFLLYKFLLQDSWTEYPGIRWDPAKISLAIALMESVCYVAILNIINLLPIPPLDGGRMMSEVILSLGPKKARLLLAALGAFSLIALKYLRSPWLLVLVPIGFLLIRDGWRHKEESIPMRGAEIAIGLALQAMLLAGLIFICASMMEETLTFKEMLR